MSSGILYTPPTPQRHGKFKSMDPDLHSKLPTPPPSLEWHNRVPDMDASNNPFLSRCEINGDVTSASTSCLPQQFFDHDNPFWNDSEPKPRQHAHADPAMKDSITYVFRGKKITYDTLGEESFGAGPRLLWPSGETSQPRGRKRSAPSDSEEDAAYMNDEPMRRGTPPQQTRRRASPRPVAASAAITAPAAISIPIRSPPRRRASSSPTSSSENDMPESHPSHPNIALAAPIIIASRPLQPTGRQVVKQAKTQLNEVTLRASMAKRNKLISALDEGASGHGSAHAAVYGSGGSLAKGFR